MRDYIHKDLADVAALLRTVKVDGYNPELLRVFIDLVAGLLDRVARDSISSYETLSDYGRLFYEAQETYVHGEKDGLIKVRIAREDEYEWQRPKDEKFSITRADVNEMKHASIEHINSVFKKEYVWLEPWVIGAIGLFKENDGFSDMKLRNFLKKMKHVNEKAQEERDKAEKEAEDKIYTYVSPSKRAKNKPKRSKIVSAAKHGKNEYKPRNRDRRYT